MIMIIVYFTVAIIVAFLFSNLYDHSKMKNLLSSLLIFYAIQKINLGDEGADEIPKLIFRINK